MTSRFQEAPLLTAPLYPDAIAWSLENFIAISAGHLVVILNPALPSGPRGLITLSDPVPYQIGIVRRADLLTGGLLPLCLKRDRQPCVRSLAWSDIGMSPNYGCLLAVCTSEGRVKLFRPPYSDFCAEWIEIVDLSDILYEYLSSINFGECENSSKEQVVEPESADDEWNSNLKAYKRRRVSVDKTNLRDKGHADQGSCSKQEKQKVEIDERGSNKSQGFSLSKAQKKSSAEISPQKYVSREAMLSSLSVAWSSLLKFSSEASSRESLLRFSLLAIGSKSGSVSVWKIYAPECYNIQHSDKSPIVRHIGMLQAHSSWVPTLSWEIIGPDSSNPQVLLVTGSSDGSVKIWTIKKETLLESSEVNNTSFSLLKQVITANLVPISTISLAVHQHSDVIHLAIGKGSGSFEVWTCEMSSNKFKQIASSNAHDQVITGLAWAFDGRCLYSCSQDNYVRNWILSENTISEVPIPANTPGVCSPAELPNEFLSCLGMALSPGNIVFALVRTFNVELLDQMYQARSQKAAVEFLWNGAQQSGETIKEASLYLAKNELACWESNFLWSLKKLKDSHKALVIWDVIAAMLTFKCSMPEFVELVVTKWLSVSFLGIDTDMSTENLLPEISKRFSGIPSRLLQILNIISRKVMLSEFKKEDQIGNDEEDIGLWEELVEKSERELRERLVGLSFLAYLTSESHPAADPPPVGHWCPTGLAQMHRWVDINCASVSNRLESLAAKVKSCLNRSSSTEAAEEEKCPHCSAAVHFDSAEEAFCETIDQKEKKSKKKERKEERSNDGGGHKLERCSVSMQVCPPTPLWFCKCCHRFASKLAPETLFSLPSFPADLKSLPQSSLFATPFCPFCGILLQRKQPEFLLSASPV